MKFSILPHRRHESDATIEIPLTARPWNTTTWPFSAIPVLRSRWTTWVWHTPPLGDWLRCPVERWWLALWENGILNGKSDDKSMGFKMLIYWNCLDCEYYWSFILIADSIRFGLFPAKFNANYTTKLIQIMSPWPIVLCSIVCHDHAEIPPIIITSHITLISPMGARHSAPCWTRHSNTWPERSQSRPIMSAAQRPTEWAEKTNVETRTPQLRPRHTTTWVGFFGITEIWRRPVVRPSLKDIWWQG